MALSSAVFYRRPNIANARRVFYGSLLYLPAFQLLAVAHRVPNTEKQKTASVLDELLKFRVPANPWAWTAWSVGGWQAWADEERADAYASRDGNGNGDGDEKEWRAARLGDDRHSPPGGLRALGESMHATSAAPFPFLPPPTWPDAKGGPRR
jgi:protoheme IX farnesyltransferase